MWCYVNEYKSTDVLEEHAASIFTTWDWGGGLRRNHLKMQRMFLQNIVIKTQKTVIFWTSEVNSKERQGFKLQYCQMINK